MSPGAPTPRTSWFRMTFTSDLLSDGIGEQGHLPGVLDGGGDVALVLGAVAGDPAGAGLAPGTHELAQQVDVLVVDVVLLLRAELAELALGLALEGALGHVRVLPFRFLSPFLRTAARRWTGHPWPPRPARPPR